MPSCGAGGAADDAPVEVLADYNYNLYGPVAVGTMLYQVIYGMFLATAYFYLHLYPRDARYLKLIVVALCALGTAEAIVLFLRLFQVLVEHPEDYDYYGDIGHRPAGWLYLLFANLIGIVCQTFMASRIVLLSRAMRDTYSKARRWRERWVLQPVLALALLGSYAAGLTVPLWIATVQPNLYALINPEDSKLRTIFRFFVTWQPLAFVFTDVVISTALSIQAWNVRDVSRGSNAAMATIVKITFTNGLLVAALQIGQVCTTFSTHATWIELCIPVIPAIHSLTVVSILLQPRLAHERDTSGAPPLPSPCPPEATYGTAQMPNAPVLPTQSLWHTHSHGQTSSIMAEEGEQPCSSPAYRRRKSLLARRDPDSWDDRGLMSSPGQEHRDRAEQQLLQVTVLDPPGPRLLYPHVRYQTPPPPPPAPPPE